MPDLSREEAIDLFFAYRAEVDGLTTCVGHGENVAQRLDALEVELAELFEAAREIRADG